MILNYSLIAVLGLGSLTFQSCNKRKEVTLQAYQDVNLHLAKFSLSKELEETDKDGKKVLKQDKNIGATFFSIENAKGEGILTNSKPLPYGTELKNIRLDIQPMMENTKIEVSLDGGATFQAWKRSDKKAFELMPSNDKLKIRLSSPVVGQEAYTYTYKLIVQVYKFDPQTIHWSKLSTPANDVLAGVRFETYTLADGQMNLMTIDEASKTNKFYKLNTSTNALEELTYPTLGAATYIKELKSYQDNVFALASDNKVYQFVENKMWQALDVEANALLGVFAPRKKGSKPSLALVVKEGGMSYFAAYDVAKKSLVKGEKLLSDFPKSDYRTLSNFTDGVGANLSLISADGLTYTSTNGTAWAKVTLASSDLALKAKSFAFVENGAILYRLVAGDKGLALFTKETIQSAWEENRAVALRPAEGQTFEASSFANGSIALWVDGQTFYLYKGGNAPELYKGELKKNAV